MPFYEISPQLKLHYQFDNPAGAETVVLLHGLGSSLDSWHYQLPDLAAAGYRILRIDQRGFGGSTYPGGALRFGDMAADLAGLLGFLGLEKVHLVGISMGGLTALQFATHHRPHLQKIVLVNTFASLQPDNFSQFVYFYFRLLMAHTLGVSAQADAVARRIFQRPEQAALRQKLIADIRRADPRAYRGALRAIKNFDARPALAAIAVPALVITGADDSTVHPQRQRDLAALLPNARQVVIPAANHAVIVDQPQIFNQVLLDFLSQDS